MVNVRNNEADHRFEAELDGTLAVADYERRGAALVLTHTHVPEQYRHQGIATALAHAAMTYARSEGLRVVPQCAFMSNFMDQHQEYQDLRAD